MTKYVYEFGQRWRPETPRYAVKTLVDRMHVSTTELEVSEILRDRMQASPDWEKFTPAIIRETLTYGLIIHKQNQALYRKVMSGRL